MQALEHKSYRCGPLTVQVRHYPVAGGAEDTGQQVNYYYDSNPDDPGRTFSTYTWGRLAEVKYGRFAEWYGYTGAGAAMKKRLQFTQPLTWQDRFGYGYNANPSINFDASYTYDNEGKVTSVGYPSTTSGDGGGTLTYLYDGLARPNGMTDQNSNTLVNNVSYGPAGELLSINYRGLLKAELTIIFCS